MNLVQGLKAIASPRRLKVLELLRDPAVTVTEVTSHGATHHGATATELRKQLGISQPALNEQMQILLDAGLVESRNVGRWVVYWLDEARVGQLRQTIIDQLLPPEEAPPANPSA